MTEAGAHARKKGWTWGLAAGAIVLAVIARNVLWALIVQLFFAYLLMAAALPLCRRFEVRMSPSLAATLAFAALSAMAIGFVMLIAPALARQFTRFSAMLPELAASVRSIWEKGQAWLGEHGVAVLPEQGDMMRRVQEAAAELLPKAASRLQGMASGLGSLMLAPLLAFYLLRDRRRICAELTLLVPLRYRRETVRAAREMRRETAGFVRGQLMLSAAVGALTALGLLAVGTPGWLVLGLLMGVLELIPYLGPILAGIPAVLLALTGGWAQVAWTLAVLIAVQQIEGGFLSPRMLAGATKLSPLVVLLAISAGGLIGGAAGMLLALPVVVSVRGALRALHGGGG